MKNQEQPVLPAPSALPELSDRRFNHITALLVGVWVRKDPPVVLRRIFESKFSQNPQELEQVLHQIIIPSMMGKEPVLRELLEESDPNFRTGINPELLSILFLGGIAIGEDLIDLVKVEALTLPNVTWQELLAFYDRIIVQTRKNYIEVCELFRKRDTEG